MEHKIIKQNKNILLDRTEYAIEIESNVAPSFEDVKKILGKDENVTVMKNINGNFGRNSFTAEAVVYDSEQARKKIETIPKKVRKKLEEEKKKKFEEEKKAKEEAKKVEEVVKQEKVEEKVEEVKEENKSEEKTNDKKENLGEVKSDGN